MAQSSSRGPATPAPKKKPLTPEARALAFLNGWKPYAELPANSHLRRYIPEFLQSGSEETRRRLFRNVNTLYKLQGVYEEQGLLRPGKTERIAQYEELLKLNAGKLDECLRKGTQRHNLMLLQKGFEFGRHPASSRQLTNRDFLLTLFHTNPMDPALKYCLYPGGILYTSGGKSHDELVIQYKREGLGSGVPMVGGLLWRKGKFEFTFDLSSNAFGRNAEAADVRTALLNAVRSTGGDDTKLNVSLEPPRQRAL